MAPPKIPWNRIGPSAPPAKAEFPLVERKVSAGAENGSAASESPYAKAQEEEVEALSAIYGEDFEKIQMKGAWSKTTDRAFRLKLKPLSDPETVVEVSVKLTATYPKTVPLLSVEETQNVRSTTRKKVDEVLKTKPSELLGEVMIYEIGSTVQEILEDEVAERAHLQNLPSLEEERALQEEEAAKQAKEIEEEELRRKDEERAEEQRYLKQMLDEEMSRRHEMKKKGRPHVSSNSVSANDIPKSMKTLTFNRAIPVQDAGALISFNTVTVGTKLRDGPVDTIYLSEPLGTGESSVILALKRLNFQTEGSQESRTKKVIVELEESLGEVKSLRQANIIAFYDFKIEKTVTGPNTASWEIDILMEYAEKGSLGELLDLMSTVPVEKVRSWTIELLEALEFYHRSGVIHKSIHAGNILLCREATTGATTIKLSDANFQENLHRLQKPSRSTGLGELARSAFWMPSELTGDSNSRRSRKTDIWDLGIVFLQMLFGLEVPQKYSSPSSLAETLRVSDQLFDIIRKFFKPDPKKRPTAFDLIPSEFLRNDVPVFAPTSSVQFKAASTTALSTHSDNRLRRESSANAATFSRYASEWIEEGRLGRGGYGEVVKARNKLDGRLYAIKKIKQKSAAAFTEVLSEVMLLSRLNHPNVVRYYSAWPEEDFSGASETEDSSLVFTEESSLSPREGPRMDFASSTGGLDFVSSSAYPKIEFGDDSDSDASDEEDYVDDIFESEGEHSSAEIEEEPHSSDKQPRLRRTFSSSRSTTRVVKTTLYIQMEYCERLTLRDLIRKGMSNDPNESWRLLRQILEGLAHIHGHGIIHRDLKPDNVFIDVSNSPRIGDFGLATSGQYYSAGKGALGHMTDSDMTKSIGTALYVAPELRSGVSGTYNDKVDMYSLGIIFFEMNYSLKTVMERDKMIRALREKDHTLPEVFQTPEKAVQGSIIASLISHRPSERPSSTEMLRSGKLPLHIEDETIKEALRGLSDTSSPYYQKMMSALFSQTPDNQVKDYIWDMGVESGMHDPKSNDVLLQSLVKDKLTSIFRKHGALETQRQILFPRSSHYTSNNVVQLLDASGTLVQLPFDLTLPGARSIGRRKPPTEKSYAFGNVYRDTYTGGAPRSNGEVDFDIVSYDTLDLALKEAEVIKVLDEIIDGFPSLSASQMCFHLNHADLLELIMEFCRISVPQRPAVKEILSKLNIQQWTWQKIRSELCSPTVGVSFNSLDDLAGFDWRDSPEKGFARIRKKFEGTDLLDKSLPVFAHLNSVIRYLKQFYVRRKIFISPLSSFNEKFYTNGVMFQCLYDTKRRDVLAAGGRYDRLIDEHRPKLQGQSTNCHAVGMNLGWDRLVTSMARYQRGISKSSFLKKAVADEEVGGVWATRRCDVLVASFDAEALRSMGVKLLSELWANDISAELARNARSTEQLLEYYKDDRHSWLVIIKHDAHNLSKPDLRVKSLAKKEDSDVRSTDLLSYLKAELRERDGALPASSSSRQRFTRPFSSSLDPSYTPGGPSAPSSSLSPLATSPGGAGSGGGNNHAHRPAVTVLTNAHRGKKTSKWAVVEAAQSRARELLAAYAAAPIAAIEARDEVVERVREARLSDPDGWRRAVQSAPVAERGYLQDVHGMLERYRARWREEGEAPEGRVVFVYNFRTGGCFLYDLGL